MIRPACVRTAAIATAVLPLAQILAGPAPVAASDPDGSVVSCSRTLPSDPPPYPETEGEVREFAQSWFDGLSRRAPASEMLSYLNLHSVVMSFPVPPGSAAQDPAPNQDSAEPPLPAPATTESVCDEAGFRKWYESAGARYAEQQYEILSLDTAGTEDQPIVRLSVAWSGKEAHTGAPFRYNTTQTWSLLRGGPHGFVIEAYLVSDMAPAS